MSQFPSPTPREGSGRTRSTAGIITSSTQAAFERLRERGEFLECAEVFGHWYGSARDPVERVLGAGRDVVFDIDWQGSQQLAEADAGPTWSASSSCRRPWTRWSSASTAAPRTAPAVVAQRMSRAGDEMRHYDEYDYVVVNTALERAVERGARDPPCRAAPSGPPERDSTRFVRTAHDGGKAASVR